MDPEPSKEEIAELRQTTLSKIETEGEDVVHPKDLQRVKNDDDWLRRFLKHHELKQKESSQMLWNVLQWRKENNVNDICEENVNMDILIAGGFFPRGKDIDGCTILIFKCKHYVKNQFESEVIRRCVIYWMERLERQTKGKPITLFFDMEKCGLANMDLDFTQYLIGLFKDYYPYFLNYVIVFEMPWILSAAFKVIKSWLPERAVKKIKFVSRTDLQKFVPKDQALTCWGGEDDYSFRFESEEKVDVAATSTNNRKVRFHDAKQMSDVGSSVYSSDGVSDAYLIRVVSPEGLLKFVKDQENDYICNLVLQNVSNSNVSYKVKTTTPEKFRVRPGTGVLAPGATTIINISLLAAYKSTNVAKDKFLILSTVVDQKDISSEMLHQIWKNTTVAKENQIHLRCAPLVDVMKNGSVPHASSDTEPNLGKVTATLQDIRHNQLELNRSIRSMMYIQISLLVLLLAAVLYLISSKTNQQLPYNSGNDGL